MSQDNTAPGRGAAYGPEPTSRLEAVGQLRAQLTDIMPDAQTVWNQGTTQMRPTARWGRAPQAQNNMTFRGHLAMDPTEAYGLLRERFAELGYTPVFRRQGDEDLIIAIPVVFKPQATRWVPNAVLLVLTLMTTTLMGTILETGELFIEQPQLLFQRPWLVLIGVPYSLTLMGILGVHELAHYLVSRIHGLDASLPYFIPLPIAFGTLGAIIRTRAPWENRKALFDVGIAGPVAGLVVALPVFFAGLLRATPMPPTADGMALGAPFLLQWMESWVHVFRDIPAGYDLYIDTMTFAAWYGIIVTGFNLLPVGQLDGGHVVYAVLGRWARLVGGVVVAAIVVLGIVGMKGWLIWATFILLSGWRHPPPLNALEPLGWKRVVGGALVLVLMVVLFSPAPFPI